MKIALTQSKQNARYSELTWKQRLRIASSNYGRIQESNETTQWRV